MFKDRLESAGALPGAWCSIPSAFSAELLGRAGYEWVCIDTQHGMIDYAEMRSMIQALAITDTPALVRVAANEPAEIMRALDAGAQGVIVPMVNSREDAAKADGACRYPPAGIRSWGPTRAALGVDKYSPDWANRNTVCIVMIETPPAVERVDEILAVPGIDAVYIGPGDLAVSAGLPHSIGVEDPEHQRLIARILEACVEKGIAAGIHCAGPDAGAIWRDAGFRLLGVFTDHAYLAAGARAALDRLRDASTPREGSDRPHV